MPNEEEILAARTAQGGWTKAQLAEWGVPWPPPRGWKERLVEESRLQGFRLERPEITMGSSEVNTRPEGSDWQWKTSMEETRGRGRILFLRPLNPSRKPPG